MEQVAITASVFLSLMHIVIIQGLVTEHDAGTAAGFLGSYLTLECPVNITENDTLEWSDTVYNQDMRPEIIHDFDGLNIAHPNAEYITVNGTRLTLDGLKSDDTGRYICTVHRSDGTTEKYSFELNLYSKPVCEGNEGLVPEGSLVTLRCSTYLSAMDFPELRWRNTRGPLKSYDVSDIIAAASELRFNATYLDDAERHTCIVSLENDGRKDEETCHIQFRVAYGARDASVEPDSDVYSPGDILTFTAKGNPIPRVTLKPGIKAIGFFKGDGAISIKIGADMLDKEYTYIFKAENRLSKEPVEFRKTFKVKARSCDPPDDVPFADKTVIGGTVIYNCQSGFFLQTSFSHRICAPDGTWQGDIPSCQRLKCGDPGDFTGANKEGGFLYNDTMTYSAQKGYYHASGDVTLVCQADMTWKGTKPTFQRLACPTPGKVRNARATRGYHFGDTVYYNCACGFYLIGNDTLTCTGTGLWSSKSPYCKKKSDSVELEDKDVNEKEETIT